MSSSSPRRAAVLAAAGALSVLATGAAVSPAHAATCSDVDVVFARGSGELAGLGIVGTPFVQAVQSTLTGRSVSSYAVNYPADWSQSTAPQGATDAVNHITSVAAACPGTKFVLGGYSQGATVVDIATGLPTFGGSGAAIPAALAPRVAAVVAYGNPANKYGTHLTSSSLFGSRAKEFCNSGDLVCDAAGFNIFAHLMYAFDGSATTGGQFAAHLA
jgi:cutinase